MASSAPMMTVRARSVWNAFTSLRPPIEPTEATEAIDPTEPTDRIEPAEPIERIDPEDPIERMEPVVRVPFIRRDVGAAGASRVDIVRSWHIASAVVFSS